MPFIVRYNGECLSVALTAVLVAASLWFTPRHTRDYPVLVPFQIETKSVSRKFLHILRNKWCTYKAIAFNLFSPPLKKKETSKNVAPQFSE